MFIERFDMCDMSQFTLMSLSWGSGLRTNHHTAGGPLQSTGLYMQLRIAMSFAFNDVRLKSINVASFEFPICSKNCCLPFSRSFNRRPIRILCLGVVFNE